MILLCLSCGVSFETVNGQKKCPYCGSYVITGADRVFTVDDKWTQSMKCDVCSKLWTLIYNEDQSYSHMSLDEYKRKKK